MMAAIVAPLGWRSIASTVSCFEVAVVDLSDASLSAATLDALADLAGRRAIVRDLADRDRSVMRFTVFDLDLLVAILLSLMSTTASRAATETSPAIGRGQGR